MPTWRNTTYRYGCISQSLHWLMAFLVIFMLALGLLMDALPGAWKPFAIELHISCGVTVLLLLMARLFWRLKTPPPALPDTLHRPLALASKAAHWMLYGMMIAMPLSGWAMRSAFGQPVLWLNVFLLPNLVAKDRYLGAMLKNIHAVLSYAFIALILLHIFAAFYHHFILKDNLLKRMLPKQLLR